MAFEVRHALPEFDVDEESPCAGAFTDEAWHKILTLAKEHGFDRAGDYEEMLFPGEGESCELSRTRLAAGAGDPGGTARQARASRGLDPRRGSSVSWPRAVL